MEMGYYPPGEGDDRVGTWSGGKEPEGKSRGGGRRGAA